MRGGCKIFLHNFSVGESAADCEVEIATYGGSAFHGIPESGGNEVVFIDGVFAQESHIEYLPFMIICSDFDVAACEVCDLCVAHAPASIFGEEPRFDARVIRI